MAVAALVALASTPSLADPVGSAPPRVQACLLADLAWEPWPAGVYALHRRFPDGVRTRHIARFPVPVGGAAVPPSGPQLILVHALGESAPGPLVQLSVSDVVIFGPRSPTSAHIEIRSDGVLERIDWPEYAAAAASFRRTGSPRYIEVERWPVWGETGAALRTRLSSGGRRLEVHLIGPEGRAFRSSVYDLAAQPVPTGEVGARIAAYASEAHGECDLD